MDFFSHKFTKHNNQCYFMAQNFNGIYRINLESGEMKFWASVPGERIGEKELFREIVCVDNKLFLIPDKATSIHVLDENANEIVKLKLEDRVSDYFKSKMKFISAFFAKGIIYLIPYGYPALIALDPYTYDMTYYDSFVYDCKKADHDLCAGMFMRGKYIKNEICLLHRSSNKLFF